MSCGNYRDIKLMCHSMKIYERECLNTACEKRWTSVKNSLASWRGYQQQTQYLHWGNCRRSLEKGRRSCTVRVYSLTWRRPMTGYQGKNSTGACAARQSQRNALKLVKDTTRAKQLLNWQQGPATQLRSWTIGLHQGSALSPFLFAIIMDVLTRRC